MSFAKKITLITLLLCMSLMMASMSFAAWWGTPGYEWALSNGLTGIKTKAQLDQEVELNDMYAMIIKYLNLKGIMPRNHNIQHEDKLNELDNVARGIVEIIDGYNTRESLTIQQYYIVENYTLKGFELLEKYKELSQYLTREDLQNLDAYLRLSRYKAATLIEKRSDREYALSRVGYVRNSKIINYGMMPYAKKLTRKEFLLVIFDLMTDGNSGWGSDSKLSSFENAGVLIGYDTGLELDKNINYTEVFAFLYRLEAYDFDTQAQKTALSDIGKVINRALLSDITKTELIAYLNELYYNTGSQIDLLTSIEEEAGHDWTVKEAGQIMNHIYTTTGFSYKDGNTTITAK